MAIPAIILHVLSALAYTLAAPTRVPAELKAMKNPTSCFAPPEDGEVRALHDGTWDRCFSVITPKRAARPMPVLFWSHGAGASAGPAHCAPAELLAIVRGRGFALVCTESLQLPAEDWRGMWRIPEAQTERSGNKCFDEVSPDIPYMKGVLRVLGQEGTYDMQRLFFAGCSLGGGFSQYMSSCLKSRMPKALSAFATHSTGLKVKGDGLSFRKSVHSNLPWSECPKCQYFPAVPRAYNDSLGLKACIFDNLGDPSTANPYFYRSSLTLAKRWAELGNREEHHFTPGGHCEDLNYDAITSCLDDGTGRLLSPAKHAAHATHRPMLRHGKDRGADALAAP